MESNGKKKKKQGRGRRGKKIVILDFSKGPKRKPEVDGNSQPSTNKKPDKPRKIKGKLCLSTSSKDYDDKLGVPETVAQREYETTGQFFRRLDRLVAKAKVEASLDERFDTTVSI